ncbi:MAG: cell envelope integrity EipB family protein [Gemmatimonas sp.]
MHLTRPRPVTSPMFGSDGFRRTVRSAALAAVALLAAGIPEAFAQAEAIAARLAPHRAAYTMSFGAARTGTGTVNARGAMLIEFGEACDGWTTLQRVRLNLISAQGNEVKTESNFSSWESKDSHSFRFTVKNSAGGKTTDEFQGSATLGPNGGEAVYETSGKRFKLPPKTLFPTAHAVELIRRAEAGERTFFNPFFDGATPEGPQEVNVVIGAPAAAAEKPSSPLLAHRSWPVRVAYFDAADPKPDPSYEVGLKLFDNGVADAFVLDYGEFTVNATLERIEPLPKVGC